MRLRSVLVVGVLLSACTSSAAPADASTPRRPARPAAAEKAPARPDAGPAAQPAEAGSQVVLHAIDGEVAVRVEVVKKQETRMRGLMFRQHMAEDAGMLFLFRAPEHQAFWMRNTYIPLDMVFIGADYRVVGVSENAVPRTDSSREVDGDSKYVLEVNAGFARRYGIGPGTLVEFRGVDETGVDP